MTDPESKNARLAAALAELNKVCLPALDEYMADCVAAEAKRKKVIVPAWAEYNRKREAIEAEP